MDYDATTKFISSLAKFLQTLCNGYVDFDNWVQINGHLILSVDSGETKEFVVNEKLCKSVKDSVAFLSNSYHAPLTAPPGLQQQKGKTVEKKSLKSKIDTLNLSGATSSDVGSTDQQKKETTPPPRSSGTHSMSSRSRKQAQPQRLPQEKEPEVKAALERLSPKVNSPAENRLSSPFANESLASPTTSQHFIKEESPEKTDRKSHSKHSNSSEADVIKQKKEDLTHSLLKQQLELPTPSTDENIGECLACFASC